jgi:hypothetical protein
MCVKYLRILILSLVSTPHSSLSQKYRHNAKRKAQQVHNQETPQENSAPPAEKLPVLYLDTNIEHVSWFFIPQL